MVFIFGRLEECNSKLVLFLAQLGEFEVVTSELVLEEVEVFDILGVNLLNAVFLSRNS
jgi:hypothetical protein